MPYPGQFYPGQFYPSQDAYIPKTGTDLATVTDSAIAVQTSNMTLGTEPMSFGESASIVVSVVSTDTFSETEAQGGRTATLPRSDTSALTEQFSASTTNSTSDTGAINESTFVFEGFLKDVSETFSLAESRSIYVTQSRTDTATQAESRSASPFVSLVPTSSNAAIIRDNSIFYARGEPNEIDIATGKDIWQTPANSAKYAQGLRGSAFSLSNLNYRGNSNDGLWLNTPQLSFEFWFKVTNAATGSFCNFIEARAGSPFNSGFVAYLSPSDRNLTVSSYSSNGLGNNAATSFGAIQDNTWYHAAFVIDGLQRRLYLNGVQVYSVTQPAANAYVPYTGNTLRIGQCPVTSGAVLEDLAFYNYALTAQQVADHYNEPFTQEVGHFTETERHGPRTSDISSFSDIVQPRFNYIFKAETFSWNELLSGDFDYVLNDLFDFNDTAYVFEKTIVTEDPFTYPRSYYGSERVRVIAQDHFTREFIHWDLPVDNIQLTFTLSGPNLFSGVISTEMESLLNLNPPLTPDRTWLHVEQGNTIIASFILTPFIDNPQNQTRQIEGEGFAAYPSWIYYEGEQYIRIQTDPADVIRYIWDHVQSFTDGNLGVKVWPTVTPVRIGYPNTSVTFTTKEMNEVSITGEPYNLNFWSVINCGEEINRLCQETPIEYWEYSQWNEFKTDIEHYIVLGYPRVGRKRTDLTFREGENLVQLIPSYQETQENYASDVFVIGAGEGPGAVRAKASGRIGRLRKTNIIQDQTISNKARAQSIADFEFNRIAKSRFLIENILVDTTHTNARWGTFIAGDDIFIQGTIPYIGHVQDWYRIVNYTFEPYARVATLNLEPSDSFTYGATFFDQFADLPHEGFAVLSDADFGDGEGEIDQDQQEQINIKLCQQQGVEAFNKRNVVNGFAYAYRKINNTINYALLLMPIDQVIDPFFLVIGRTQQGYLITGANVYLVATNGTIGQAPETTATQSNPSYTSTGGTVTRSSPFDPALQIAAREYYNAFVGNIHINADLSFIGISANAEKWRSTIGYLFYTVYGKHYNYDINSPGGDFAFMVGNISRNVGF